MRAIELLAALSVILSLVNCDHSSHRTLQGYVEGEFVYIASPRAGRLESLAAERGATVAANALLFQLESEPEKTIREEAAQKLLQARATLDDARKGKRPSELESLRAQLRAAEAALMLSEHEFERQRELLRTGSTAQQEFDQARSRLDQDRQRIKQLRSDLETGELGLRADQIEAAEREVKAREAALSEAEWSLAQKAQVSPQAGFVFDTLYRAGEYVAAARPVVILLPPENIKVRSFVPETLIGAVKLGAAAKVLVDGAANPWVGRVSYISPKAEFTPPVIFSREMREKLVFMIEVVFAPEVAIQLHPGQPVDVQLEL